MIFVPLLCEEQPGAVRRAGPAVQTGKIQTDLYNKPWLSEDEELTVQRLILVFFWC